MGLLLMEVSYWVLGHSFYWPPNHLCKRPAQLKWRLKMQSGVLLLECRRKNSRGKGLNEKEPCPSQGWNQVEWRMPKRSSCMTSVLGTRAGWGTT